MATLGGKMYLIPMHWPAAVAGKVGEVVTVNKQTRYHALFSCMPHWIVIDSLF